MKTFIQLTTALCLALALALPVAAQEEMGTLTQVLGVKVNNGSATQFEDAVKTHLAWHKAQNDTWRWHAYEVMTGPYTGEYRYVSPGHFWKDYDGREKFEKADAANIEKTFGPYLESSMNMFYRVRPEVSRMPDSIDPMPLASIMHIVLHPKAVPDFEAMMQKIHEAMTETKWGSYYVWYSLENGGASPEYALVFPIERFADMAPPEKPFPAMLEEAFGRHDAAEVMETIMGSIESERTEILRFRSDLSYIPASN